MNPSILNPDIQAFIEQHLDTDVAILALKGTPFTDVSTAEIIMQIAAKKRCKHKLSTWFDTTAIYYPNTLNIEQTSSEVTAKYKTSLLSGTSIIDITGGFGVDCFYFSKRFAEVTHCETNAVLSEIVTHNYKQLHATGITTYKGDGLEYLKDTPKTFDWLYVDPSRRHDTKGKVFFLKDCLPNVPEHLEFLFSRSKRIMIKTSPLLDISIGSNALKHVKTIHIVAVNNDVKELVWILEAGYTGAITMATVNMTAHQNMTFSFEREAEAQSVSNYSPPLTYLYEPNAAILKSGGFHQVATQLHLFKLHQHSHLYTNTNLIAFPGRRFKIEQSLAYNKKNMKRLGITKANITTRNFPETVQQLRKKYKIKDGGDLYLFFTTDSNATKRIILASKCA